MPGGAPRCDTGPMQRVRGWLTVWIIPFIIIAASVVPLVMYWTRYPDPLAVRWGFGGEPNGTLPLWLYAIGMIGAMVLTWWGLISGTRTDPNAPLVSVIYFILGLLAAINAQVLSFNLDASSWEEARNLDPITFGGVLLVSVLAGGLGWLLGGGRNGIPEEVELEVPETTATSWSGKASNLWLASVAVVPIGFAFMVEPVWTAVLVVIALLVVVFSFVEVEVDQSVVVIALGPLGIPRRKYRIEDVTAAGAIEVQALAYGGWGWRIRRGQRAFIIRNGPAIRIERAKRSRRHRDRRRDPRGRRGDRFAGTGAEVSVAASYETPPARIPTESSTAKMSCSRAVPLRMPMRAGGDVSV